MGSADASSELFAVLLHCYSQVHGQATLKTQQPPSEVSGTTEDLGIIWGTCPQPTRPAPSKALHFQAYFQAPQGLRSWNQIIKAVKKIISPCQFNEVMGNHD